MIRGDRVTMVGRKAGGRDLLLSVWDELWLSRAVHEAWDNWVQAHRHAAV